jgi:hypothetical protein
LRRLLTPLLLIFSAFFAYATVCNLWWIYDPLNKDRDGTPLFAFFTFFQLPVALLMGVVVWRDVRKLLANHSDFSPSIRYIFLARVLFASVGVLVTAWMLIEALLLSNQ